MSKKMMMTIVPREEAEYVLNALINAGYTATFTETEGGVLRQSQLTMFIVVDEEELEKVVSLIRDNCRIDVAVTTREGSGDFSLGAAPVVAGVGGAIVFIWTIERVQTF
ncbi:MAG: cyclic-di-AMP receptor [Anaerolineaceae bacterium]|nr:cyclic-di-AMP receptor [Anaerolineaceae bacterium]